MAALPWSQMHDWGQVQVSSYQGLVLVIADQVIEAILTLRAQGCAILLVEQLVERALEIADQAYVMRSGRILGSGTPQQVRSGDLVRQAYMSVRGACGSRPRCFSVVLSLRGLTPSGTSAERPSIPGCHGSSPSRWVGGKQNSPQGITMISKQTMEWATSGVSPVDKTDLWESVLSASYREWEVPRRLPATFHAHVKQHAFAGAALVETVCDPCTGRRTKATTHKDDALYVGVQLTTQGRERFKANDCRVEAQAGDLVVWTTDAEMEFEVIERLHKVTLMIPWHLLRERLPERRSVPLAGKIESRSGIGSLLAGHLLGLANQIGALSTEQLGPVSRTTMEFLGIALANQQADASFDASAAMLRRAQDHILQNLHQELLTPTSIASANRISVRYLHLLFQRSGTTVRGWIQERRLAKCKEMLGDPAHGRQRIADIAYRGGFTSTSHFSRVFRDRYGMSPSDARAAGARDGA